MDACKLVDDEINTVVIDNNNNTHNNNQLDLGGLSSSSSVCRSSIKPRRVFKVASPAAKKVIVNQTWKSSKVASTSPSIPCHTIFIFLDPLLLEVLQAEYQNKKESPLDTNPIQMKTFLVAICIYSMVLGIKIQNTQNAQSNNKFQDQILNFVLLASGSVSSGALFSILLHGLLLWLVFIILGSMPILLCRHLIKDSANWVFNYLVVIKSKFSNMVSSTIFHYWKKAQGSSMEHTDYNI